MSDHTATLVIDNDHLRVVIACNAPPEAECHGEPGCECEEFSTETLPDGSHGHTVYRDVHEFAPMDSGHDQCRQCDELPEHDMHTGEEEVWHPHRQREGYCNYLVWVTESGYPQENYEGPPDTPLNETPIVFDWHGDHYTWRPAPPVPAEHCCIPVCSHTDADGLARDRTQRAATHAYVRGVFDGVGFRCWHTMSDERTCHRYEGDPIHAVDAPLPAETCERAAEAARWIEDRTRYNEDTLFCGVIGDLSRDLINAMQNVGILFRERMPEASDFYEDDEPIEHIQKIRARPTDGVIAPPCGCIVQMPDGFSAWCPHGTYIRTPGSPLPPQCAATPAPAECGHPDCGETWCRDALRASAEPADTRHVYKPNVPGGECQQEIPYGPKHKGVPMVISYCLRREDDNAHIQRQATPEETTP